MAKVKVQALRPMWSHARGAEFETSVQHAAALVRVGAARYVPPTRGKRNYKRRDLTAEGSTELDAETLSADTTAAQ